MQVARDTGTFAFNHLLLVQRAQLAFQLGGGDEIDGASQHTEKYEETDDDKPGLAPERGFDGDGKGGTSFIPIAILIAGNHVEHIAAVGQLGKISDARVTEVGPMVVI